MRKSSVRYFIFLFILAMAAVLAGCAKKDSTVQAANPNAPGGGRPPAPVVVTDVERRDVPVQITAIGNVEAYQTVQIRSQVNGQIESVHFREGQDVSKGQLLFTLDKRPFQATLEQAIGNLKRDQANSENAQITETRYTNLEGQGIVSKEQADQARSQAKANTSSVYADQAAVNAAKVQLQYTEIRSPIDARAGALMINLGNLVKANDTPFLVQLNQIAPIYVTFSIPETRLADVRQFMARHLNVLAYPKGQSTNPSQGVLTFIDNAVDPQTGTVKLKATFQNRDKKLWPGEFVNVVLNLSTEKNATVVATKAVQTGQQGDYVYVVKQDGTAEARPVKTAGTYQNLTLVADGLNAGETVVFDGQMRVTPNGKVTVSSKIPGNSFASASGPDQASPSTGGGQ